MSARWSSNVLAPANIGERKRKDWSSASCLCTCCGVNLYGADGSYNIKTNEELAKKISALLPDSFSLDKRQSSRVCKRCFRRVQSLAKKWSDLESDLKDFRNFFSKSSLAGAIQNKENVGLRCPSTPKTYVKRSPKWSPPSKRSKLCGQLFSSDGDEKEVRCPVFNISPEVPFVEVILR